MLQCHDEEPEVGKKNAKTRVKKRKEGNTAVVAPVQPRASLFVHASGNG